MTGMLPLAELLTSLAEETCELGQAALKLRRVFTGANPTPVTQEDAIEKFEEEIADVMLYLDEIGFSRKRVEEVKAMKLERWKERLILAGVKDRAELG